MQGFSIQFVSKITGINPHTIRAWEKRYQAVVPSRNETGKRIYSQEQVDRLGHLNELVKMGNSISDMAKLDDESLKEMYGQFSVSQPKMNTDKAEGQKEKIDTRYFLQNLILALTHYKLDIISHELDKVKKLLGPRDFALDILSPLLNEVGVMVAHNNLSIAQEHALSSILRFHIGHLLYGSLSERKSINFNIAISTPEGELHEFGIMIASLLCASYNINFYYLGPNMPADALAQAANQIEAKIVILGVTQTYQKDPERDLEKYVTNLISGTKPETKIWLGGESSFSKNFDMTQITQISTLQMLDSKLAHLVK